LDKKRTKFSLRSFFGSPCWTRTNDLIDQKHCRVASLEAVAPLVFLPAQPSPVSDTVSGSGETQLTAVWC